MFEIFQYSFVVRGFEAGILMALLAPLIGIFLVLRRYALIADTLSHVSLAGVAVGLLLHINPLITALVATTVSSVAIDRLRISKKVYGETALAMFLSGGLALAIVLISVAHGFKVDLFSYLFGSILTVSQGDVLLIAILGVVVIVLINLFYKELVYISFDEEAAEVSGIPTKFINTVFIILSAVAIALSIPVVGILLISALMVIPVVTALQFKKSFTETIVYAECISVFSVIFGLIASFYWQVAASGLIVLTMLGVFGIVLVITHKKKPHHK